MSIDIRYAMNTWGVTFQSMVPGRTTSYLVAKEMANLLKLSLEGLASIHQLACSSVNDRGLFNLYVRFDWAPDPYVAQKLRSY